MADLDNRPLVIGPAYNAKGKTVLTGQTLAAGSVMGVVTASGKLKLCDNASADGSEVAKFVLTKAVDASGGDVTGVDVLKAGVVNGGRLVFGGDDTLADHDEELRDVGIITVTGESLENLDNS